MKEIREKLERLSRAIERVQQMDDADVVEMTESERLDHVAQYGEGAFRIFDFVIREINPIPKDKIIPICTAG